MTLGDRVLERSTRNGVVLIGIGMVLLVALRFWANPLTRRILGRDPAGFVDFIGIPVFLVFVGVGIVLFLWEPDGE